MQSNIQEKLQHRLGNILIAYIEGDKIVIAIVTILFAIGLYFCLKPLTGRIMLRTNELKQQIKNSQKELQEANDKLRALVDKDFLTGALNRRGFDKQLDREIAKADRYGYKLILFYFDLDKLSRSMIPMAMRQVIHC